MRNMKRFWLLIFVAALGQLTFYGCGKSEEQLVAEREAAKAKAEGERKAQEQKAAAEQIEAAIRMVRESLRTLFPPISRTSGCFATNPC